MTKVIKTANFNFKTDLIDLIKGSSELGVIECKFKGRQSVKHLVESMRVPHTEVGNIISNGNRVDLDYIVQDTDQIEIWPVESVSLKQTPHFIADNHLGKLTKYLRILGFDTLYRNDFHDDELAKISYQDERILLTRDRGLLMRKEIIRGVLIRSREPREQMREVLSRYQLQNNIQPFQRCLDCNTTLIPVDKEHVKDRLQPLTKRYYNDFHLCQNCDKLYWKGSHYEHINKFLHKFFEVNLFG